VPRRRRTQAEQERDSRSPAEKTFPYRTYLPTKRKLSHVLRAALTVLRRERNAVARRFSSTLRRNGAHMYFPEVQGENLAGQPLSFPDDFRGSHTIALIAFDFKQRADIDTWAPFINRIARNDGPRARLFPVLPRAMRMMEKMIVMTLCKDVAEPAAREATVPLFVDLDEFCSALAIVDRDLIHTFVVAADGSIRAHITGLFDEAAGRAIEAHVGRP
jgi:hypothetical protein